MRSLGLVTTSERGSSSAAPYATPEDDAVIRALGSVLGVTSEDATRATREALEAQLAASAVVIEARGAEEEESSRALWFALGTRWPELLDPFRADFEPTLRANAREVAALFRAPVANAHAQARRATDRALLAEEALRVRWVQLMRLERAFETRRLAHALAESRSAADPARRHYEALLACERAPLQRSEPTQP